MEEHWVLSDMSNAGQQSPPIDHYVFFNCCSLKIFCLNWLYWTKMSRIKLRNGRPIEIVFHFIVHTVHSNPATMSWIRIFFSGTPSITPVEWILTIIYLILSCFKLNQGHLIVFTPNNAIDRSIRLSVFVRMEDDAVRIHIEFQWIIPYEKWSLESAGENTNRNEKGHQRIQFTEINKSHGHFHAKRDETKHANPILREDTHSMSTHGAALV